ncbi:hypothetical protein UFOVP806_42 [uncultured Caudovirales phage]|uniref:N-acetyltransferase domain-containing protein n=1 Tax=uncultured Caudovirales phage TaxID=2100421 RepID=A0A6J5NXD4_9CAUD|nr:hypothetical protein UFOVP806_42 [uncultured Caudovirales phage]
MPGSPLPSATSKVAKPTRMSLDDIEPVALLHIVKNMRAADAHEIFSTTNARTPEEYTDEMMMLQRGGLAGWIASQDGVPIAALGIMPMWQNVVTVWMFATDDFPKIALQLTRFVRRNMVPSFANAGIHRAQCFSMNGHVVAQRWLTILGAKRECVVKSFGSNKEDFTLYSWTL